MAETKNKKTNTKKTTPQKVEKKERKTEEVIKEEKIKTSEIKTNEVNDEKASRKNIIIIGIIILVLVLGGLYIYKVNKVKQEELYNKSYLIDSGSLNLEIKNIDEVNQILTEAPSEYFVLITYTGNKATYNLETGLKEIVDKYKLSDSFYYLNIKDMMNEDNYLTRLNSTFNTNKIKTVPIILYYKDGKLIDTVTRYDKNVINASDFQRTLDIYEYQGQ